MKNQLLGLMLVCSSAIGFGQTLDLETCLRMADTANLEIRNARLAVASDEKQVDAYLTARLPKITATGDYKYNAIIPGQVLPAEMFGGPPGTYQTVQFGVPYNLSNTLQLTQILFNPQINYGIAALKLNHQIVEIQQKMTERDIHEQVASTFFTLQAINKQYAFVTANISSMDKLIANMEAMQKEGMVVGTEVDKLKINRLTLMNSQQTLAVSKEQLEGLFRILIGVNADAPIQLVSDEMVEQTILVDKETVVRPELEMLEMQRKLNLEERKGTNMAYLPSLSLYGAYNYTYNMNPSDDFRTGIESAMVGLRLDWTLFDGLEKMQKQKANRINLEKIENQQELVKRQLDVQLINAKKQIEIQSNSLLIAKEQVTLAQRVYDQSAAQFSQGTIGSNDLIIAENNLREAQTQVVTSYVNLRQAEIAYLKAIGYTGK